MYTKIFIAVFPKINTSLAMREVAKKLYLLGKYYISVEILIMGVM